MLNIQRFPSLKCVNLRVSMALLFLPLRPNHAPFRVNDIKRPLAPPLVSLAVSAMDRGTPADAWTYFPRR